MQSIWPKHLPSTWGSGGCAGFQRMGASPQLVTAYPCDNFISSANQLTVRWTICRPSVKHCVASASSKDIFFSLDLQPPMNGLSCCIVILQSLCSVIVLPCKGCTQTLFILFNSQPLKLRTRSPRDFCITNAQHKQPVWLPDINKHTLQGVHCRSTQTHLKTMECYVLAE